MSDVFLILACTAIVSVSVAYVAYILGRDKHAASLRITALDLAITEENRNGSPQDVVDRAAAYTEFLDPKPVDPTGPQVIEQEAEQDTPPPTGKVINATFREI